MRKLFLWLLALGLLLSGCGQAGEPAEASAFLLDTAVSVRIYEGGGRDTAPVRTQVWSPQLASITVACPSVIWRTL